VGTWTSCQNYHYGHPPTFYLLMSLPDRALQHLGFPSEVLGLRLLSLLLVVPLTYYAARQVWPTSTTLPLAAAAVVALFAPLAADAAAVNNDSLMLLLAGCLIAAAARLLRQPTPGAVLAVGLATGGGLLVKSQFQALTLAAAAIVAVALTAIPRREWLRCAARFVVPVAIGSAWWLRNLVKFHTLGQPGGEILRPDRPGPWNRASLLHYALHHVDDLVGRFWGLYGQTAVETPSAWRTALSAAAGGLLVVGAAAWFVRRRPTRPAAPDRLWALAVIPVVLVIGPVFASFQVYRKNGEVGRGLLGRYVYPGLPVLAIAAVAALVAIATLVRSRRPRRVVHAAGVLTAGVFCVGSFLRAMHGFYGSRANALWLHRARIVSAVPTVATWLAVVFAVWLVAVATAAIAPGVRRKLLSPIRDTLVVETATGGR